MPENTVPNVVIGPPKPSKADFFLPQRGSKSLDAAKIRIGEKSGSRSSKNANGSSRQSEKKR